MKFHPERWDQLSLGGRRYACVEGIRSVDVKGKPGVEKVFVGIERRIGIPFGDGYEGEEDLRKRLWSEEEDEFGGSLLVERRNIVFMRERSVEELKVLREKGAGVAPEKMLKRTFSYTPFLSWFYFHFDLRN